MPKRSIFTASQKAAMMLEALQEGKPIAQIVSETSVPGFRFVTHLAHHYLPFFTFKFQDVP